MKLLFSRKDPPIGAVVSCSVAGVSFQWCTDTQLILDDFVSLTTSQSISRHVARLNPALNLYPTHILHRTQVDHWLSIASKVGYGGSIAGILPLLNSALAPTHCLVPPHLTVADYELFAALHRSSDWQNIAGTASAPPHVLRWYNSVLSKVRDTLSVLPADVRAACSSDTGASDAPAEGRKPAAAAAGAAAGSKREEGGKFVDLPDAKMGEVVVRFPPEASGYLHIGHAKAALLNQHYQLAFKGKLIMRFDDTNPAKEDAHFEQVILEDLKMLQVKPDCFTHTSDYFDLMLQMCEKLIKESNAYVDDTDAETMKIERDERKESKNRNNSVEQNISMWEQMKTATELGQKCAVRAKIDMNSNNGCMRDPTIYRCKPEPHVKTGNKYKVYPTYDFACPIVDSVEGVTHALRTTEYHDRDDQFFWFIEKLGLRKLHIYEYSRLNMNNTVLSKRKLAWFVEQGLVDGWDDPRFPTVRGIMRRGMTVEGLKEFIIAQGSSRSVVNMEWDKIWSFNKKVIDATAPRYVALERSTLIPVNVVNAIEKATAAQKHPKDPSIGNKTVWVGPKVFIETVDAELLKEGENATFINWGNLVIKAINRDGTKIVSVNAETNLDNTDYKKTLKLTWLVDSDKAPLTPAVCVSFDHLINKGVLGKDEDFKTFIGHETRFETAMLGDDELKLLKRGDIIQLQRKGFFKVDQEYKEPNVSSCKSSPVIFFSIPDGHSKDTNVAATSNKTNMTAKELAQTAKGKKAEKSPQEETKPIVQSGELHKGIEEILQKIKVQGDKIRQLKTDKAEKNVIMNEVTLLKELKANFSSAAGIEWTPTIDVSKIVSVSVKSVTPAPAIIVVKEKSNDSAATLHQKIIDQGNVVRNLKSANAAKDEVKPAVEVLISLKSAFKTFTNVDWTPKIDMSQFGATDVAANDSQQSSAAPAQPANDALFIHQKIVNQGDIVRKLKSEKAESTVIIAEVDILKLLKKDFKDATNIDWNPKIDTSQFDKSSLAAAAPVLSTSEIEIPDAHDALTIHQKIVEQGNKVRSLKSADTEKNVVNAAVAILLQLKESFKSLTSVTWKQDIDLSRFRNKSTVVAAAATTTATKSDNTANFEELNAKVKSQGDKVRQLKSSGADNVMVKTEVDTLLQYKQEFKDAFGVIWKPDLNPANLTSSAPASRSSPKPKELKKPIKKEESNQLDDSKKQTRLGLEVAKAENLSEWYSQVIIKSEMIEYYNVSGCYILRPWSYSIWDHIKDFLDAEIKKLGVENSYFPIFVSRDALEKEKSHIADFSPEVAWVTRSGSSELAEPIAIRPTSETAMYPAFAKWIQSHRDLPLRLNQWNNVVRWEFKQPTPFLRTREFLWQEGHTAFATKAEATKEVYQILDIYARVYEDLLAIPIVKGKKTEKEKFAGADFTTTTEAFISASGRAIQGATSHHLGQNFSKMFEIIYEDPVSQKKEFVYQNSWGMTTRTIGVMVMVHGDDKGLVLPPKVASRQAIIMPVGITGKLSEDDKKSLYSTCDKLASQLNAGGVRTQCDFRDNVTPAWKFNHWELKGVPLRLEVGPREVAAGQVFVVRRDTGEKQQMELSNIVTGISALLDTIHSSMFEKAKKDLNSHKKLVTSWSEFCETLDDGKIILAPFCGQEECEDIIKKESARDRDAEPGAPSMGAKSLCIPFQQPQPMPAGTVCIHPSCSKAGQYYCLFGRSY